VCESFLSFGVRPILQFSDKAHVCIAGQAPGMRAHKSGIPYSDPSGDRLREWLGIDHEIFYDPSKIAIIPMGMCFPGYAAPSTDAPPRPECAPLWREKLFAAAKGLRLTLLVGLHAQRWHLRAAMKPTLTETVRAWREYGPRYIPLPHPSWRNNGWLKANPWFERELLPHLRRRIRRSLREIPDL
jgi:uracil-DNA glycosylase